MATYAERAFKVAELMREGEHEKAAIYLYDSMLLPSNVIAVLEDARRELAAEAETAEGREACTAAYFEVLEHLDGMGWER